VAQNQLRLEISSSRDKEVGAYAEVLVSKTKSFTPNDVITYAAANEFGIANLTLQNGLFYAKVVAVGYQDLIQEIRVNASSTYPLFIEPTDDVGANCCDCSIATSIFYKVGRESIGVVQKGA